MKQCPKCKEHFEDEQNFCDFDGTLLRDETALLREAFKAPGVSVAALPVPGQTQAQKVWPIVIIGILIGIIICLGAYVVMLTSSGEKQAQSDKKPETARLNNTSDRSTQAATVRAEALPVPTAEESPTEETETGPAAPTPAEPLPVRQEVSASLNTDPISTNRQDGEKRGHMVIKLKSGVRVEADAAWQDRSGVWYRQGGLVSYVDRERIESIGEPAPSKSPTETDKP